MSKDLIDLKRMETALVRAELANPGLAPRRELERVRYLLGFARLDVFQPGAALIGAPNDREDVSLGEELAGFRGLVLDRLEGPLRIEKDPAQRLRLSIEALSELTEPLEREREVVLARREGSRFSREELDAEAGRKVLVSVAGGGGGAGHVYIGAYQRMEEAGIVPDYLIGSSIGAVLGIFRASAMPGRWDDWIAIAKGLDRRTLFSPITMNRRFGFPGALSLHIDQAIGDDFLGADDQPLRIRDLPIPFEAVVAGVRRGSTERQPARFRRAPRISARSSPRRLSPSVGARLLRVGSFFNPRVTRPIVLGADELTAEFDAIHAAGFSAAIPGVLHYDIRDPDSHMVPLLEELFEREEVSALVDGGVAANVPAEIAWRRIQAGKLGTRNAFLLAFDCFHPRRDPGHIWLQPITRAVQLQMVSNVRFADWLHRFERTLSPVNLVPPPEQFDAAVGWGRNSVEALLPMLSRLLEPVSWDEPQRKRRAKLLGRG